MIQRIQSVLLLIAVLVNLATFVAPLWEYKLEENTETINGLGIQAQIDNTEGKAQLFTDHPIHIAFFSFVTLSALLLLVIIFQYNDRKRQIRWAYWGLILLFIEIVSLIMLTRSGPFFLSGNEEGLEAQWGFAFPVIAIVLVWIAIKRIQADENLIRSMDRLR